MLSKKLLEILCCPKCKGQLKYRFVEDGAEKETLTCTKCQLVYLVENDIPILLIDKARKLQNV